MPKPQAAQRMQSQQMGQFPDECSQAAWLIIRHVAGPLFLCILVRILADDPSAISVEIASCAFLQFDAINLTQPQEAQHIISSFILAATQNISKAELNY